jgi:ABC-type polysaccharide/polyol phosphate export permease
LPLEARMGGIFLGFLCAILLIVVLGRLRASQPPRGVAGLACWTLVALTTLDGLNAFLSDGNLPHLYSPNSALRLLTGLGAGLAVGLMAVPVVGSVVWSRPSEDASVEDPVELLGGLVLAGLVGALVLAGVGVLLWPIALAMLVGVVVAFGVANLYLIVLATRRTGQAVTVADLGGGLLGSVGLSLLEIGALAALRGWLVAAFGFTWGV